MTDRGSITPQYQAKLTDTTATLSVGQFFDPPPDTPGNVGVCLCGGGSRAMTAGMGQLRALAHLQANGKSLLSQVKAISTVSGGSWLGVPFEYLAGNTTDEDYLNAYVADPGDLVPSAGSSVAVTLDELPSGNIGAAIDTKLMSVPALAVEAFVLAKLFSTPANMLWQVLVGAHLLRPYGLFAPADQFLPDSLFSYDGTTLQDDVTGPNPDLASETAHLFADAIDGSRICRPFLICNTSMFVDSDGVDLLAPVQATAFFTGVVGTPDGNDANGKPVGGGGVTSFAFNSAPQSVSAPAVAVSQHRQWALTDIAGASSAAFAAPLQQIINDPEVLLKYLAELGEEVWHWIKKHLPVEAQADVELQARAEAFITEPTLETVTADIEALDLGAIVPRYDYWPVLNAVPDPSLQTSRFADGGSLENTGVGGMLAYDDIDSIISCLNSSTALAAGDMGVIDADGNEVSGTRIIVDGMIPPLFGYQPYDSSRGYVPFAGYDIDPQNFYFQKSQVFAGTELPALLQGLWAASGNEATPGSNATPATFSQQLTTQANDWFGVKGGRSITVVWVYMNRVAAWYDLLNPDVQAILGDFHDPRSFHDFPHYSTLSTNQSPTETNLISSLTAWCVADPSNASTFTNLFAD